MAASALYSFARFYNANFDKRPVPTLMLTNGILNTIADILAQSSSMVVSLGRLNLTSARTTSREQPLAHHLMQLHDDASGPKPVYDPARTLRFAAFGMFMGPIIGGWMRLLERRVPLRRTGNNTMQLAKRVVADQLIMAPFGMVIFTGSMGLMEGKDVAQIRQKFSDVFLPALIANWKVWPLIQTINFKVMPLPYRVPFQSTCGIGWVLYLSLLNASKTKSA